MMQVYEITYKETYEGTFTVEAETPEEAEYLLRERNDLLDDVECLGSEMTINAIYDPEDVNFPIDVKKPEW